MIYGEELPFDRLIGKIKELKANGLVKTAVNENEYKIKEWTKCNQNI